MNSQQSSFFSLLTYGIIGPWHPTLLRESAASGGPKEDNEESLWQFTEKLEGTKS